MQNKIDMIKNNIKLSTDTIYSDPDIKNGKWYGNDELEKLLNDELIGIDLTGLELRTRSKVVKEYISEALGYPVPRSFKRTQPRFPSQNLDVYTQQSKNLQIWNEDVDLTRRYAIIKISQDNIIKKIKIVTGKEIAPLDKTGTLTRKFQASLKNEYINQQYIIGTDSEEITKITNKFKDLDPNDKPSDIPRDQSLMSIEMISDLVSSLIGSNLPYLGATQERTRGDSLHNRISTLLGYQDTTDDGSFPDIKNQLLEVKLQTSPTVDLGLSLPSEDREIPYLELNNYKIKVNDIRYIVVYGTVNNDTITITQVILINGRDFFDYFDQFQGNTENSKIQLTLPDDFFE